MTEKECKTEFWWITGRAASGKSTYAKMSGELCRAMGIQVKELCDEKLMLDIIEEDVEHTHHYHPEKNDKFLFRSCYPFDEGIRRISERCRQEMGIIRHIPSVTIVELARGRKSGIMNFTFQHAFELIDPAVVQVSHFTYIETTWENQLHRNRVRAADNLPHPPDSLMESLYSEDDFELVKNRYPFTIVKNNSTEEDFHNKISVQIKARIIELLDNT